MRGFLALAALLQRYVEMRKVRTIAFAVLVLLLICFIWGQSMMPRDASARESTFLMRLLKPLLDPNNRISSKLFHHYLRKAAHFTEYAALGFCMSGFLLSVDWKRERMRIPTAVLSCLLIAAADESIQLFSVDRGAQLRDVVLDFCGALFGLAVYLLLACLVQMRGKKEAS